MKYFYLIGFVILFYGCISSYNINNETNFSNKQIKIDNSEFSFPLPNNFKHLIILNDELKKSSIINSEQTIKILFTPIEIEEDSMYSFVELLEIYNALLKSPVRIVKKSIINYNDKKYAEIILEEENKLLYLVSCKNEIIEISAQTERTNKFLTKEIIENIIKYLK